MEKINENMKTDLATLRETNKKALDDINSDHTDALNDLRGTWFKASEKIGTDLASITANLTSTFADLKSTFEAAMQTVQGLSKEDLKQLILDNDAKLTELNTSTETILNALPPIYQTAGWQAISGYETEVAKIEPKSKNNLRKFSYNR